MRVYELFFYFCDMKTGIRILCLFLIGSLCACGGSSRHVWDAAVEDLERTLEGRKEIELKQGAKISSLRSGLREATDAADKYRICDELFDLYIRWDLDSAFLYAHSKDSLASESGDKALMLDAKLDLAIRYNYSGMYYTALETVTNINTSDADDEQAPLLYRTLYAIYHGLAVSSKDELLKQGYRETELYYQALSQESIKEGTIDYYTVNAGVQIDEGKYLQAREMLENALKDSDLSVSDLSAIHYWLAKTYRAEGDTDGELQHYAISAKYDMLIPVRATRSMANTARLLYEKGAVGKAFFFITNAYEGATQSDARICLDEIAAVMPVITASFDDQEQRKISSLTVSIQLLILLLVTSLILLFVLRQFQGKLRKANASISAQSQEIKAVNASMQTYIARLKDANNIKDIYLGRYMSMFSENISGLERYRSRLRTVSKSRDISDVLQELKSDTFIDTERSKVYEEFDNTFLGVYPDFVSQLNALLREESRIGKNLPEGRLNNELRIFALIRLGVTESAKIAQFLKKSPSTIYNYRVKLRNSAVCGHDQFEKRLMEIGNP